MNKETQQHQSLKQQAKSILKSKGFSDNEIFEEYKWQNYIIDIIGINSQKVVIVECGYINNKKYNDLVSSKFIEFIHLPYNKNSIRKYAALATMDDELYKVVQQFVEKHDVDYPSASFFINQAVKEKLQKEGVEIEK